MPLHILWTSLFSLWVLSEIVLAILTRTSRTGGTLHDRGSQLLLWITIAGSITLLGWIPFLLPSANLHAPWLRPAALIVLLVGLAVRWTAILSLGRAFSVNVAIRPDQQIYRGGLYRFIRHPSYLGMVLIFVAIGFHSRNWAGLLVILVSTTAALFYRIHIEEQALHQAFGVHYAEYARSTDRLIPGIY